LLNDGQSVIAVTSQRTLDWITVLHYKIVDILGPNRNRSIPLLGEFGIRETKSLKTAWDMISKSRPGDRFLIESEGKTVYDVVEELKKDGMFLGKVLECREQGVLLVEGGARRE